MIKAVLFDMNGVIINDEKIHELAFAETLKPLDINFSHTTYLELCCGRTDEDGYKNIEKKFIRTLPIQELLKQKGIQYMQLFPSHKKAYPGVIRLVKQLAENFRIALTSSASRAEVDLVLTEFGIKDYFEIIITGEDVKNGKPDPEPYLKTVQLLNLNPNECVVVEDSINGVRSAKDAGCFCIGVTTTHKENVLREADVIVHSFECINKELISNIPP